MNNARPTAICSLLVLAALGGCSRNRTGNASALPTTVAQAPAPVPYAGPTAAGTVVETINASEYTYVRVKTASGDIWAAASKFNVKVGDRVIVPVEMPMVNFHSNSLNRTFPMIYFTSQIFHEGAGNAPQPGR